MSSQKKRFFVENDEILPYTKEKESYSSPEHSMLLENIEITEDVHEEGCSNLKVVDHYVIGRKLGEGSFSKVKEVLDMRSLHRRAAKIVRMSQVKKVLRAEECTRNEISIMSSLDHKNILKLYEVIEKEEKGKVYLILEFCYCSLPQMLAASDFTHFPVWQAHLYFKQLIHGLCYLHSKKIVHKDIKPSNMLLAPDETLKLADFGISEKIVNANIKSLSHIEGSPAFLAPELIDSNVQNYSPYKVDIWAAGVSLYNLVTGSFPFDGDNIFTLYNNIMAFNVTWPESDSDDFENLLKKMLTLKNEERIDVNEVVSHRWLLKIPFVDRHKVPLCTIDDLDLANRILNSINL